MDKKELAKILLTGITCSTCHFYITKTCYANERLFGKKPGPNDTCEKWVDREHFVTKEEIGELTK